MTEKKVVVVKKIDPAKLTPEEKLLYDAGHYNGFRVGFDEGFKAAERVYKDGWRIVGGPAGVDRLTERLQSDDLVELPKGEPE